MVSSVVGVTVLLLAFSGLCSGQRKISRTQPVTAEVKTGVNFDCPEEFGYYPHPTDCTQYYVCVFGGALLESCTGGLMYSHELQTCDWPRNVGCDAAGEVTVTASAPPTSPSKAPEPARTRYTPPPPPPQPAAVVTSRGQPRQLHHNQQEIIKQQQQLYEDAEETLPPAEEIENDRQQRVYRGQPSTVGQVQRDRDGLRHSNAIPNYGGRSEKIGVISFGTQQSQPIQQYSKITDNFDLTITNDLTLKRSERRKRQTQRSRHPGLELNAWRGGTLLGNKIPSPTSPHLSLINFQPSPQLQKFAPNNYNTKNNFVPIIQNTDDFQPFLPLEYKRQPHSFGKIKPNENFQFYNLNNQPPPKKLNGHISTEKYKDVSYTFFGEPNPIPKLTTASLTSPFKITNSDALFPGFTQDKHTLKSIDFSPGRQPNRTTTVNFSYVNLSPKIPESATKSYKHLDAYDFHKYPNHKPNPNIIFNHHNESKPLKSNQHFFDHKDVRPAFLSPSTSVYETTTYANSLGNTDLSLEEVLERIRESYKQPQSITTTLKFPETIKNKTNVVQTTHNPFKYETTTLSDDYYYYDDDEEDENDNQNNKYYSSHLKPFNNKNQNQSVPINKKPLFDDDDEYYYEEYDYPETTISAMKPDKSRHQNGVKYSARYSEKLQNLTKTNTNTNFNTNTKTNSQIKSIQSTSPSPSTSQHTTNSIATTQTPKTVYTIRQRMRPTLKTTTRPSRGKNRQRLTTNRFNDNDSRHDKLNAYRVEVTSVGPSPQPSVATATARALYNATQQHNDPAHYDSYYNLYEDDVELYRDVDYTQHYNTNSNREQTQTQHTYRGTPAPTIQQSQAPEEPKRGNTYLQNSYTAQDVYQQPAVADYNEDNSFNSQVDDQNSYRQSSRQPSRGDRNELNYIEDIPTTKRTTTTTKSSRTVYTQKSTNPSRSPVTSKANQTRALSLPNTLPENPGHTLPISSPTTSKSILSDRRLDADLNAPITYRPKFHPDTITDYTLHAPIRSAIVNQPAPFTLSTTIKPQAYHFITKASKSTPTTTVTTEKTQTEQQLTKRKFYENAFESASSIPILPTTYAPPKFFLKSILPKPITTSYVISPLKTPVTPVSNTSDNNYSFSNFNNRSSYVKANSIKAIRKFINPIAINNIFSSSTESYLTSDEALNDNFKENVNVEYRNPYKSLHRLEANEPFISTTIRYSTSGTTPSTTSTSTSTTTTTTTFAPPKTTSTTLPISSSSTFSTSSIPSYYQSSTFADLGYNSQTTERYRHYVEPNQYVPTNTKNFRNTVEVPAQHEFIADTDDFTKPEPDQPPTFKPKPPLVQKLPNDVLTKTAVDNNRNTSLPARVSRVNTAIKSVIGFGGSRRQNPKCNENQTTNVKCNEIKQRTNTRGRGSAHYSTSNAGSTNLVGETVNRGTPPTRSRPTLKPSTSIVSKAAEFIDIYRFPPRRPDPIYPQPQPDKTAAKCRKDVCLLPDCSCGGKDIPGDLPLEQVPQIVLLTFDDSVNDLNKGLYSDLFEKGRVNPNGCPISATLYISHEWTDYSQVQNLYADGHEIASHTVSHSFGEQFSQKKWTREVAGQREILSAYAGVKLEDIRGMRAPFLSVGGNKMFKMLYDSNFTYDSSMPIYENKPPSWPYTLDYKLFHPCMIPPCPTRSYPGVWEVPMVMWQDLTGGRCSMADACSNPSDADGVFKMIMKNFERHYTTNRAPFGLYYHAAWFTQPHHKEGFINFLDTINSMKDVYIVTNWQAIQWVRDPTPLSRIGSFQPFQCNYADRPKRCNNPKVCNLWHKSGVRYMRTCQPCPDVYPWTGNTGIRSSRIDNDIED